MTRTSAQSLRWLGGMCGLVVAQMIGSVQAHAAINIDRTRIIFNGKEHSSSVILENQSRHMPYLAQSWIENAQGVKDNNYIMALPPMQRIEPTEKSQVRLMKMDTIRQLPTDRETLFYFNVREVPPKSELENVMQVAIQSRIKLFYRPEAIKPRDGDVWQDRLQVARSGQTLTITNPTPYYITIGYMAGDDHKNFAKFDSVMVAPFGHEQYTPPTSYHGNEYTLGFIDDYGGLNMRVYDCTSSTCTMQTPHKER
ncbi:MULTISPECIES: molecular chaperone [unclassified Zymobacter]|uniref:fimbrial biogenesis chaperone n=1 Tax=unclassified Zymobacter TaxID=3048685 RepID=UPI0039C01301